MCRTAVTIDLMSPYLHVSHIFLNTNTIYPPTETANNTVVWLGSDTTPFYEIPNY